MPRLRRILALAVLPAFAACAMHSTATRWNGHVGPDGEPVFVLSSTYLGVHLVGLVPVIGDTTIDDMVDESTQWVEAQEGGRLRLIETEANNYWWSVPPLSWIFSPVMTSVTFEYRPSAVALAEAGVIAPRRARAEPQRSPAEPQR